MRSRVARAAVRILRADIQPDFRTSAWGSWSRIMELISVRHLACEMMLQSMKIMYLHMWIQRGTI